MIITGTAKAKDFAAAAADSRHYSIQLRASHLAFNDILAVGRRTPAQRFGIIDKRTVQRLIITLQHLSADGRAHYRFINNQLTA
jgi:hypothetical protein